MTKCSQGPAKCCIIPYNAQPALLVPVTLGKALTGVGGVAAWLLPPMPRRDLPLRLDSLHVTPDIRSAVYVV